MMSKTQWFILLCLFWLYLLLGAYIFFIVESQEERFKFDEEIEEKRIIEEMMLKHFNGDNKSLNDFLNRLTDYCGKSVQLHMTDELLEPKWDFYHSLFFVITVVSTIGYGNLVPTTMVTRIFMIFYGLIGIPMNGIVMVTMGEYFGKSFKKLYERWKNTRIEQSYAKFGLVGQIILYAVPGLTFFIILPSTIMSVFEGWDYDVSVYYAFVTLTTIGFGDYVAGVENINNFNPIIVGVYQAFLLIWVIGGIGYLLMIINFISQGMRSRKVRKIEKLLADNIKKTPQKIRNEFRALLHEFLFVRVKPVYKGEFDYVPHQLERSISCPDLSLYRNPNSPTMARKRAMSECYRYAVMQKTQSETELAKIDMERTFKPSNAFMQQRDLILKFFDALSSAAIQSKNEGGIQGFSDAEILASESYGDEVFVPKRRRAQSDIRPPPAYDVPAETYNSTWYGNDASVALKEFRKMRAMSTPNNPKIEKTKFFKRIRNKLKFKDGKDTDVEKQTVEDYQGKRNPSIFIVDSDKSTPGNFGTDSVLEQTSVADVIRALANIQADPEEQHTFSDDSPRERRHLILPRYNENRRTSLNPSKKPSLTARRYSLRPVSEQQILSPDSFFVGETRNSFIDGGGGGGGSRRFSVRPTAPGMNITSPVQTQVNRRKRTDVTGGEK